MKPLFPCTLLVSLTCLCACARGPREETVRETPGPIEQFTGQIVRIESETGEVGYRFKPQNEPENLQRFTRAKGGSDLASLEINLRKYFGKTLVVQGDSRRGWLLRATVLGQWLRPGEKRGSTLLGPEPIPAKPR